MFRYWVLGNFVSGTLTVTFLANSYRTTNSEGTSQGNTFVGTVNPDGFNVSANGQTVATPNIMYLDVVIRPAGGMELDLDAIADANAELVLDGSGRNTAALITGRAPTRLANSDIFRYFLVGSFGVGEVIVRLPEGTFQSVSEDEPGQIETSGIGNLATEARFQTLQLTAEIDNPGNAHRWDVTSLMSAALSMWSIRCRAVRNDLMCRR